MSFKEIQNIQLNYYSLEDDIANEFYIPCLEQAIKYKRAVGFFSSSILLKISKGLGTFADHKGKMKLLVSTRLEENDYEAIKKGYDAKELLTNKIVNDFDFDIEFPQKNDRFNMLSYMVETGLLDIKIVAMEKNNDNSMYHIKTGVMEDEDGNIISFSGSANETENALIENYENIDVYCSWASDESEQRCSLKEMNFDSVWNGNGKGVITVPFPDVIRQRLLKFNTGKKDNFAEIDKQFISDYRRSKKNNFNPFIPDDIEIREYQDEAIKSWESHEYRGIYDMATGTGKTYTGIASICHLFDKKKRLIVIISVPYIHLVDQWCEDLVKFNINPIKCYGGEDYKIKLKRELNKFKHKSSDFICICICNDSFKTDDVQNLLKDYIQYSLLIVDEAHNVGANSYSTILNNDYPYRLALSATIDRYGDIEGTKRLYDFFGEKCITYTLKQAIIDKKLTPYNYYPIVTSLDQDEYDQYISLSKKIGKSIGKDGKISEYGKKLLLKRARLISGTKDKLIKLKEVIKEYKNSKNLLVYCGAVKYGEEGYKEASVEKKQIDLVIKMLNIDMNISALKFTAEEDAKERKQILKAYKEGDFSALVAIKCLDEGMNVPSIKTAFILSSSTNPKEYIQRRGRVLRLADNKEYAEIYDFITVPYELSDNPIRVGDTTHIEQNLVKRELSRIIDFALLSRNPADSNDLINKLKKQYNINIITEED